MENIKIEENEYKVIKKLKSDDKTYYYTLDLNNDNEVVILYQNKSDDKIEKVEERDYPILMNKFALK